MKKMMVLILFVALLTVSFWSFASLNVQAGEGDNTNLIEGTLGTFEADTISPLWDKRASASTLAVSTEQYHGGTRSMKHSGRTADATAPRLNIYNYLKTNGAGIYHVSMWLLIDGLSAPTNARIGLRCTGVYSFLTTTDRAELGTVSVPDKTWKQLTGQFTVTAADITAESGTVGLCLTGGVGTNTILYIDDVQLYKEAEPTPSPQPTPVPTAIIDNGDYGLLDNGGFEYGTTNWLANNYGVIEASSDYARTGMYSLKVSNRINQYSSGNMSVKSIFEAQGVGTYKFSFYARLATSEISTASARAVIDINKLQGDRRLVTPGAWVVLNNSDWTLVTLQVTLDWSGKLPLDTAVIRFENGGANASYTFDTAQPDIYVDDFKLEKIGAGQQIKINSSINSSNMLSVSLDNTNSAYKYQVWYYAKVTDPTNAGSSYYVWTLVSATGSISAYVADAVPASDGKYKIMVVTVDSSGNAVQTQYDDVISLGDVELGVPKIKSIQVDGAAPRGTVIINKDTASTAAIQINAVNATSYELYTLDGIGDRTDITVAADGSAVIDFTALAAGNYTFTAVAKAEEKTSDTATVTFEVYSPAANGSTTFPEINSFTYGVTNNVLTVHITPKDAVGTYWYNIGNEWTQDPAAVTKTFPAGAYGNYTATVWVRRSKSAQKADDGFRRTLTYARPDATLGVSATYTVNDQITSAVTAGDQVDFTATGTVTDGTLRAGEVLQYRFVRNDARDWVVIKDWSTDNTLAWTPALAGNYTIRVDVKGSLSGEYEALAAYQFEVAGSTKAQGTLTLATISGAKARTPIELSAAVTGGSSGDVLQYRYDIIDAQMGRVVAQAYSADNTYTWIPRKAGTYTIEVKVINQNSFGQYDLIDAQEVVVE